MLSCFSGLVCGNRWDLVRDQGFVLLDRLTAGGTNEKMRVEILLLVLGQFA